VRDARASVRWTKDDHPMTPKRMTGAAAVIFAAILVCVLTSAPRGQAQAPAPATPPADGRAGGPQGGAPGGGGRGRGGRGNPTATLYTEQCSGCHGVDIAGGRAPSLFDPKWLDSVDDAHIVNSITNGVSGTEMEGFKDSLTQEQIWNLVYYIRTQTGAQQPKPAFVADPNGLELKTEKQTVKVEVLTSEINTPFGMAFLPDGRLLITERNGAIRIWDKGKLSEPVKNTPKPHVQQDGGYLDITVHPKYAQNGWIYLSYSEDQPGYVAPPPSATPPPAPGGFGRGRGGPPPVPSMTVVVRGKINKNNEWTDQQFIFRAAPELYTTQGAHYGSRFIWDAEGHLFFTMGERGDMTNAQKLTVPLGKIHRFNDDGTAPKDNPFVNTPGAVPTIWSYGHRNPEGLAWDPLVPGRLWEAEHGPNGGDEINIIQKGHDYGWGIASKGIQPGITKTSEPGMEDPIVYYTPSLAPAQISFYTGNRYPGWKNTSLFVGGLIGQKMLRLEIAGDKVTKQEVIFNQLGRVRNILQGPDGYLYIALQDPTGVQQQTPNGPQNIPLSAATPGKLIRLVPVQ
jgi:glucose/arabinose dehydrogenase